MSKKAYKTTLCHCYVCEEINKDIRQPKHLRCPFCGEIHASFYTAKHEKYCPYASGDKVWQDK